MPHQASPAQPSGGPPAPSLIEIGAALATGGLLTLMILFNGTMAAHTTPLFASFTAHGVGTIAAAIALAIVWWRRGAADQAAGRGGRLPFWIYLGGISGAVTVMLTSWTVNSPLALTGTLALGLAGQVVLALIFDTAGAFGLKRRRPKRSDILALAAIFSGTGLIILGRGMN